MLIVKSRNTSSTSSRYLFLGHRRCLVRGLTLSHVCLQIAKYVVALGEKVSPTDIEEGMRVGVDRNKYQIQIPLPPKIDPSVTMMTVEEKPDVTYADLGGVTEQIEKIREVVELPLLQVCLVQAWLGMVFPLFFFNSRLLTCHLAAGTVCATGH